MRVHCSSRRQFGLQSRGSQAGLSGLSLLASRIHDMPRHARESIGPSKLARRRPSARRQTMAYYKFYLLKLPKRTDTNIKRNADIHFLEHAIPPQRVATQQTNQKSNPIYLRTLKDRPCWLYFDFEYSKKPPPLVSARMKKEMDNNGSAQIENSEAGQNRTTHQTLHEGSAIVS